MDETPAPIPVTVVAGFLGAGKTTLLNHILTAEHGLRVGVLVNDFGSINVDAELITEVGDGTVSLANGCICCSIRMDLIKAVLELADRPDRPEHIVIESSGVADPAGIVSSFLEPEIWGTVQIDAVITVVDAEQALELPEEEHKLAQLQVTGADLIALNKVDLVDEPSLGRVREWIDSVRPGVQVFETTHCRLPLEVLFGVNESTPRRRELAAELGVHVHEVSTAAASPRHDHHDHHGVKPAFLFDSWTFTSDRPMRLAWMQEVLKHLPSTVFRAKGFVRSVEEPQRRMVLQLVGRRATVTPARPWGSELAQTRLVFISRQGTVNYAAIEKALHSCEAEGART